jgi:hypothetical protein
MENGKIMRDLSQAQKGNSYILLLPLSDDYKTESFIKKESHM